MNTKTLKEDAIKKMVICAIFVAMSYVCVCVFRIKVSFLTLDIKDAVITIAAMILGPIVGVVVSVAVAFIEMFTISDTQFYGFIMNFLSSATFAVVAASIYRIRRSLFGAIVSLVAAVLSVTAVMMLANLLITPYYMGVDRSVVVDKIPTLLLPFNLTKAVLNSAIVMIIYKPITTALKRAKLIKRHESEGAKGYKLGKETVMITVSAAIVLTICLVIFFIVFKAQILNPFN